MANDEVMGPKKTMMVLVIVVGCFAVLWPRILSPLLLGPSRDQLKPNQFDREAGCCEVLFETDVAVFEMLTEICSAVSGGTSFGKLSPYAAAECRKAVNETCNVDIAEFLKRSDNVGKTSKSLLETMKRSNSTCLQDHFGVPVWSLLTHQTVPWNTQEEKIKQERPPIRAGGMHPAIRERGRAIPSENPTPPSRGPVTLPPHIRVRSPLSSYFEYEIQPPPIPGMRPPLGSPGGPVTVPKSSMGFIMPIYTICIIIFFVYTLSKILFKRTGTEPYEYVTPDPEFRSRVFRREDSRASPDNKLVVTAISGLVAEVQQQMEASYAQNQQGQDLPEHLTRPYTNGTLSNDKSTVRIVASEYREKSKEYTPDISESSKSFNPIVEVKEPTPEPKDMSPKLEDNSKEELSVLESENKKVEANKPQEIESDKEISPEPEDLVEDPEDYAPKLEESTTSLEIIKNEELYDDEVPKKVSNDNIKATQDFLDDSRNDKHAPELEDDEQKKQTTPELLAEALREEQSDEEEEEIEEEESEVEEDDDEPIEKSTLKVLGMEVTAHSADGGTCSPPQPAAPKPVSHEASDVKNIFLETEIPQQSKVLVADFASKGSKEKPTHSPSVVSGKMTLSLIQDAPSETPERELESTCDDFTTASGLTQPAIAEKIDELSDEDLEEEIEDEVVEEIEEEEEEEQEEIEEDEN